MTATAAFLQDNDWLWWRLNEEKIIYLNYLITIIVTLHKLLALTGGAPPPPPFNMMTCCGGG